jgi:site-specific DNA recombinase
VGGCGPAGPGRHRSGWNTQTGIIHSGALARHEQQISRLQEAVSTRIKAGETEAAAIIRELIESVTVRRRAEGFEVEIRGRLNMLLGDDAFPNGVRAVWGSLVAEEGFEPPTHGL